MTTIECHSIHSDVQYKHSLSQKLEGRGRNTQRMAGTSEPAASTTAHITYGSSRQEQSKTRTH
eukprot:scaffold254527_cov182-Cyclotella_meneghiniana.AAC.1